MNNPIYISLGCDCSVAYQLQKLNLRSSSFPFDWIRINHNNLINILNNNFQFFTDIQYLNKIKIDKENKFPYLEEDWTDNILTENMIVHHDFLNIKFYHDFQNDDNLNNFYDQKINFQIKYNRRIQRFRKVCKDSSIKKIFVRIIKNSEEKEKLNKVLEKYCQNNNFELKTIIIDKNQKFASWKKDELDWDHFFIHD